MIPEDAGVMDSMQSMALKTVAGKGVIRNGGGTAVALRGKAVAMLANRSEMETDLEARRFARARGSHGLWRWNRRRRRGGDILPPSAIVRGE
jgi:hypothetical protein